VLIVALPSVHHGELYGGTRAKHSGGLFFFTEEECLLKQIMLGDDGLYLETTPVGDGLSTQMSPVDCPGLWQLGTFCLESDFVLNQTTCFYYYYHKQKQRKHQKN
jgi:hypothetical protein